MTAVSPEVTAQTSRSAGFLERSISSRIAFVSFALRVGQSFCTSVGSDV